MTTQQQIQKLEQCIHSDPQKCLEILTSSSWYGQLFQEELSSLNQILESSLKPKKNQKQSVMSLHPQLVIILYSLLIMKKANYNTTLAIETLSNLLKNAKQPHQTIIASLLLNVQGFNNYKLIVRLITPEYVSLSTLKKHIQGLWKACPALISEQLSKYKHSCWAELMTHESLTLELVQAGLKQLGQADDINSIRIIKERLNNQMKYIDLRIRNLTHETMDIELLTSQIDSILKSKAHLDKQIHLPREAALRTAKDEVLLSIKVATISSLIQLIEKVKGLLLRKIKWLSQLARDQFINVELFESNSEQQTLYYCKVIQLMFSIYQNFGQGAFPNLHDILFDAEYSLYRLVESILYNEYSYNKGTKQILNFQKKWKKKVESQQQFEISCKSLNINPFFDALLMKLIPNIGSNAFYQVYQLVGTCLEFWKSYYLKNSNVYFGGKILSMLANAKNDQHVKTGRNTILVENIQSAIYPTETALRAGLELFCEEYCQENLKRKFDLEKDKELKGNQQEDTSNQGNSLNMNLSQGSMLNHSSHSAIYEDNSYPQPRKLVKQNEPISSASEYQPKGKNWLIKKTQSFEKDFESWSGTEREVYESKIINSDMFYSIKQCSNEQEEEKNGKMVADKNQDIIVPQF